MLVKFFSNHGHVAYQINGDDEQNRMRLNFHPRVKTGDLGVRSKGQISLNFCYHVDFKDFYLYQTLCVFSQIKDRKHIEQDFYSDAGSCPRGGTWGCWGGVKNFSAGICYGAPSTALSR